MAAGVAELAGRLDRRVRERAAAIGTGLPPRTVLEVVLTAILPMDDDSRADQPAWTTYYAAGLTGAAWVPQIADEALAPPTGTRGPRWSHCWP